MQSTAATEATRPTEAMLAPAIPASISLGRGTWAWRRRLATLTLMFSDLALALLVWEIACLIEILWAPVRLSGIEVVSIVPYVLIWVGLRAFQGLYPGYGMGAAEELRNQTHALAATLAVTAVFALAFQIGDLISRLLLAVVFGGLLILAPLARHLVKRWMREVGVWGKPVAILGSGEPAVQVERLLKEEWGLGFRPVAVFDARLDGRPELVREGDEGMPHEDVLAEAVELAREHKVDTIILALSQASRGYLAGLADLAGLSFRNVIVIPDLVGVANSAAVARDLGGTFGLEIRHNLLAPWVRRAKRMLDLLGVVAGGLLISPLLITIALLIKLDSPGTVFYGHHRLGAGNGHFRCWKFRTMHADADRLLDEHLKTNPDLWAEWEQNQKLRDDPRVTRVGDLLRKSSLDELPQLWNVLRGQMSLIGPRPIVDEEVSKYGEVYALYQRIRPGMSGFWQVSGRSDTGYAERVAMDAHYVRNWSVWLDLVILARTVGSVALGRGAR